jgi:hypothetical protein
MYGRYHSLFKLQPNPIARVEDGIIRGIAEVREAKGSVDKTS